MKPVAVRRGDATPAALLGRVMCHDVRDAAGKVAIDKGRTLDNEAAYMAKWWCTEQQGKVADECLQLFGGYGYMAEYPIARMYADARVQKIYGGANEVIDRCLQLFGGYGYMLEYPIARAYADARVQKIYGGTNEIMKELIARAL